MARLYSPRSKAVRPRSNASCGVARSGWRAGRARRASTIAQRGQEPDAHSAVAPVFKLHDVGQALAGAHADLLGGEGVAGVDGDLDLLAGVVVGEERDVDLLAGRGRRSRATLRFGRTSTRAARAARSSTSRCAGFHLRRAR